MSQYRLHYFPESGNSYKLALMLTLCGQTFDPVWTDFGSGVTRTPEWRKSVNPMGEIPVLDDTGTKLTQTAPILLMLADRYGKFGAAGDDETFELLRWLIWDNQKLSGNMATYRYLRAFTPTPKPDVLAFLKSRVDDALRIAERLFETHDFVLGERPTVVDFSMCAYLSFPKEEAGYDLAATHPAVHRWLGRIAALPGWRAPYDLLEGEHLKRYV